MPHYTVKVIEPCISIAHQLNLPYVSPCNSLHGHNYSVEVLIESIKLNPQKMVVDFTVVKKAIRKYDHSFLGAFRHGIGWGINSFEHVEPSTAENFAGILLEEIQDAVILSNPDAQVEYVKVWETPNNCVMVSPSYDVGEKSVENLEHVENAETQSFDIDHVEEAG